MTGALKAGPQLEERRSRLEAQGRQQPAQPAPLPSTQTEVSSPCASDLRKAYQAEPAQGRVCSSGSRA